MRRALALIGLDRIAGYFAAAAVTRQANRCRQMTPIELSRQQLPSNGLVVIDVRNDNEWNEGHIAGRDSHPARPARQRVNEIPAATNVVVQCQGGGRSSIAASLLQKLGRKNVANLTAARRMIAASKRAGQFSSDEKDPHRLSDRRRDRDDRLRRRRRSTRIARAKPMIENAGNYMDKAREVARLGESIKNKSPYEPPKNGELTPAQVERFVAVQTRVRDRAGRPAGPRSKRSRPRSRRQDRRTARI